MLLSISLFIRAVVVPVVCIIVAAIIECTVAIQRGKGSGPYKYRVWVKQTEPDGTIRTIPRVGECVGDLCKLDGASIVDIEQMMCFSMPEFGGIAIDLIIGALAVDLGVLINAPQTLQKGETAAQILHWSSVLGYVQLAHFAILICVIFSLIISQHLPPEDDATRRRWVLIALLLSALAMVTAFISIRM